MPVVTWDADAIHFRLRDPDDPGAVVTLAAFATAPQDPRAVAVALAEYLAACDFPPVDDHASTTRVRAALRVSGVAHPPLLDAAGA